MNEVATQSPGGNLYDPNSTYNPFAQVADEMGANLGVFMKFNGNTGDFLVGEDEVPSGTRFAVDAFNAKHGWICWKDSAPVDKVLIPIISGPMPEENTLKDHGPYDESEDSTDGWSKSYQYLLTSPASGTDYSFEVSARSSISSLGKFMAEFGKVFKQHPDEVPLVEIGAGSYMPKEKKRGRKYFATFTIVGWVKRAELEELRGKAAAAAEASGDGGADDPANYGQKEPEVDEAPVQAKQTEAAPTDKPMPSKPATGRATRTF